MNSRCPEYLYGDTPAEIEGLHTRFARLSAAGASALWRGAAEAPAISRGALGIPRQGKFHSLKYIAALKTRAAALGAQIFDDTPAEKVEERAGTCVVYTPGGQIEAPQTLVATHYPAFETPALAGKLTRNSTYVLEASLPRGVLPEALWIDQKNPYHYMRLDAGAQADRLILGGEDHNRDEAADQEAKFAALEAFLKQFLPPQTEAAVVNRWRGGVIESADGLPYIGPLPGNPRQFVATGYSGNGLTFSRIAAQLFADHVCGQANPWAALYSPER